MSYSKELYQQVILDHNKNPRNFRTMEPHTHHCEGRNPLCGDQITLYLQVSEDGKIEDVAFQGSGCAISKSSASLMTTVLKGKSVAEAEALAQDFLQMVKGELEASQTEITKARLGKLAIFEGVKEFSSRVKCASLPWHALGGALKSQTDTTSE